jgi:diaminohydroxyphosphoribosylaminopyrimidine deaminase/5-amino-6-(5-phosphoribosylamino)uracil reductase
MSFALSESDVIFMRRAMRLAMNGRGQVEPNPMVGCVIVKDDRIIGEGFHQQFGGPHAEPNALANCTESPHGATAYVTLEPCCHTDKKTPPCVPRLIEAKIARVVIGCLDPNPQVNGQGIARLRAARIQVDGPLLEAEAKQLNAAYFVGQRELRPYITLKWAQSSDGKIAGARGSRLQISNPSSTRIVHLLRSRSDAIAVGINTVLVDDPELSVREVQAERIPLRVVFDSQLRIPEESRLVRTASHFPLVVFCTDVAAIEKRKKIARLDEFRVEVDEMPSNDAGKIQLSPALRNLRAHLLSSNPFKPVTHVLVEPGPTLAAAFLLYSLADRLWVFRSNHAIADDSAPAAAGIPSHFIRTGQLSLNGDVLTEYLNPRSPVFFAAVPSADFALAMERR